MQLKDILGMISEYSEYYDAKRIKDDVQRPLLLLPEEVLNVIPSFAMGRDGEYIESLFLITENLLCEVRLTSGDSYGYDFINISTTRNIRYITGTETFEGQGEPVSYKFTQVTLLHHVGGMQFQNKLTYIGENPDEWLEKVKDVLPVELLI